MTEPPDTVGRYQIERLLAHGGMGSVYLARDPAIDRRVVIKFLKAGFDDASARERFAREARAAGRLHHPNIVTVFDVGEHDNRPFIAMEYVSGETLAQLIGRRAVTRVSEKLAILEELCAGLHYAHLAAIVHRDIKPANVMREQSGVVKILDFGIARGGGGAITQAGDVVGTLNYMAPEQLAGENVDHRADVYAVGALGYELITGQMAFPGTIQTGVLFKILNGAPVPIDSLVPGIDPDIIAMIQRAMGREPDERYQDLEIMRQDLEVVRERLLESAPDLDQAVDPNAETRFDSPRVGSSSVRKPSSRAGSAAHQSSRVIGARPSSQVSASPPRRAGWVVLLGVACAALAGALVWTLFLNRPAQTGPPVGTESAAPPSPQPSAPPPAPPAVGSAGESGRVDGGEREKQLSTARLTARQQIVAGQRERALDTAVRGLAVDDKDPELNAIVDEMTGAARRSVTDSRAAAVSRGASGRSSSPFRDGQARELEADTLLRAGDRVGGIRAAWTAAALYNKASEGTGRNASGAPPPRPPTRPAGNPPNRPPSSRGISRSLPLRPPSCSRRSLAGRWTSRRALLRLRRRRQSRNLRRSHGSQRRIRAPPTRQRSAKHCAATRRPTRAWTAAAVGRMMPSLTDDQLRDLRSRSLAATGATPSRSRTNGSR